MHVRATGSTQIHLSEIHLNCPSIPPPLILHRNDCLLTDNHQELANMVKKKVQVFRKTHRVCRVYTHGQHFFFQMFSSTRKNIFIFQNFHTVGE